MTGFVTVGVVLGVLVLGVLALGAVAWHLSSARDVQADDAYRSSSLGVSPWQFDGAGVERALVADLRSTHNADVYAHVTIYWTEPGGQEEEGATAQTERLPGDADLQLSYALPVSEFPSGTQVRALFTVKDVHGATTMASQQRTARIP